MNLETYKILCLSRHQDLRAEAAQARLARLVQEHQTNSYQKFLKFFDTIFQKVCQKIVLSTIDFSGEAIR